MVCGEVTSLKGKLALRCAAVNVLVLRNLMFVFVLTSRNFGVSECYIDLLFVGHFDENLHTYLNYEGT